MRAEARIATLLEGELARWRAIDADLAEPIATLRDFVLGGGKRLRPAFCHWAFVGAGGDRADTMAIDAGAALELLHTFALVHDDVMDGSDTRRGRPSVHRRFVERHVAEGWNGEARRFGEGAAILVGDFAFVYADRLLAGAPRSAMTVYHELRVELCIGQYLDLAGAATGAVGDEQARRIETYKAGKYTVERPLHLGAALAGRLDDLAGPLSRVGLPLGEAFQLRDDLLGVYGDSSVTGKPVGDDLREGKGTPLVALARERANPAQRAVLDTLGVRDLTDTEVKALQEVLDATGARERIERRIERCVAEGFAALDVAPLTDEARAALEELGRFVAWRDR